MTYQMNIGSMYPYPGYVVSEPLIFKSEIVLNIADERSVFDFNINVTFKDFEAIGLSTEKWMKYLYKIFGEEYKNAYLAECEKLFE